MTDFTAHLHRQAAFSRATFGPGPRTKGVMEHIGKEFEEIERVYATPLDNFKAEARHYREDPPLTRQPEIRQQHMAAAGEWTDVAILGLDGLLRAVSSAHPDWSFEAVAAKAVQLITLKQCKNELRDWPDWRGASPDQAIEHVRGKLDDGQELARPGA